MSGQIMFLYFVICNQRLKNNGIVIQVLFSFINRALMPIFYLLKSIAYKYFSVCVCVLADNYKHLYMFLAY